MIYVIVRCEPCFRYTYCSSLDLKLKFCFKVANHFIMSSDSSDPLSSINLPLSSIPSFACLIHASHPKSFEISSSSFFLLLTLLISSKLLLYSAYVTVPGRELDSRQQLRMNSIIYLLVILLFPKCIYLSIIETGR